MQGRDLKRIKWHARALSRNAELSYMQALDQAARDLFGVRHFHEAQARARAATRGALQTFVRARGASRQPPTGRSWAEVCLPASMHRLFL